MYKSKNIHKLPQFIPKTNTEQSNDHLKKNDSKLTYDEIRKIVEHSSEKEIQNNHKENQIKNKFNIV